MKKIGYKILSPLFLFGLLVFSFEANPALNENFDNSDFQKMVEEKTNL